MILDLSRIEEDEVHIVGDYEDPFDLKDECLRLLRPPSIDLVVRRTGEQVRAIGSLDTELSVLCDRCLTECRLPVASDFDLLFLPADRVEPGGEMELSPAEMSCGFYREDQIDVDALVREQIHLALPFQLLCQDNCRGLCERCGADLNRETCRCEPGAYDPRWSNLRGHPFTKES